jgi:hypothetical protein
LAEIYLRVCDTDTDTLTRRGAGTFVEEIQEYSRRGREIPHLTQHQSSEAKSSTAAGSVVSYLWVERQLAKLNRLDRASSVSMAQRVVDALMEFGSGPPIYLLEVLLTAQVSLLGGLSGRYQTHAQVQTAALRLQATAAAMQLHLSGVGPANADDDDVGRTFITSSENVHVALAGLHSAIKDLSALMAKAEAIWRTLLPGRAVDNTEPMFPLLDSLLSSGECIVQDARSRGVVASVFRRRFYQEARNQPRVGTADHGDPPEPDASEFIVSGAKMGLFQYACTMCHK